MNWIIEFAIGNCRIVIIDNEHSRTKERIYEFKLYLINYEDKYRKESSDKIFHKLKKIK